MMACHDPEGRSAVELESRPEHLPGWSRGFDEAQKAKVIEHALPYLRATELGTDWVGKHAIHRPAMAGYRALVLLERQRRLGEVTPDLWKKWAPAVIAAALPSYPFSEEPRPRLVQAVMALGVEAWKPTVDLLFERQGPQIVDRVLSDLMPGLDAGAAEAVLGSTQQWGLGPQEVGDLLQQLSQRGGEVPTVAARWAAAWLEDPALEVEVAAWWIRQGSPAAHDGVREHLRAMHRDRPDAAVRAWGTAALRDRFRGGSMWVERLGAELAGDALRLLMERVPTKDDPVKRPFSKVLPQDFIFFLRDRLLSELVGAGEVRRVRQAIEVLSREEQANLLDRVRDESARLRSENLSVQDVLGLRGGSVFLSYRRKDDEGTHLVRCLYERLRGELGRDRVWRDTSDIEGGENFQIAIEAGTRSARVMIVAIGSAWADGIETEGDWVRSEVAHGLRLELKMVPVLLEDQAIPKAEALPDDLRALADIHALPLSHARFDAEAEAVVRRVRLLLDAP